MKNNSGNDLCGNERMRRLSEIDKKDLPTDGGPHFNRLIFTRSPYLLQHAGNPVDWFPWCEEAFAKAKSEDKPIFLSIGYATCHWCHVMERESFEDKEVAKTLNDKFVSIKVDREERPDIDDQYMVAAQLMTGGGGWPLTIIMTPEGEPFFAATYLPKTPRKGVPGIVEILERIDDFWKNKRDAVRENCSEVMKALKEAVEPSADSVKVDAVAGKAFQVLLKAYDDTWCGFGKAPKFPLPHYLSFLLRFWKKSRAANALWMAEDTLKMIRRGGIFDQIGFGIHRYAVDRKWLVPHFEKMLYDQALTAYAYLETYQATEDAQYRTAAEELFSFVLDEMRSPEGGFYSAWDADTNGVEGRYYTWTPEEILSALGNNDCETFCRLFGVTEEGNFEGRNILHLPTAPLEFAEKEGLSGDALLKSMGKWRKKLIAERDKRTRPLRDEKILTSWNGLMITSLAKGYAVTREERYRQAADSALKFVSERLRGPDGRLLRSWYGGNTGIPAFLEDYAFLGWSQIQLYEATLDQRYLGAARQNAREMMELFLDSKNYGLFDTASDVNDILLRKKGCHDGVSPSGNSVAAMNLIKLGKITDDPRFLEEGKGILRAFMGNVAANPMTGLHFLSALDYLESPQTEITFTGSMDSPNAREMLGCVHKRFIPGLVLRVSDGHDFPAMKEKEGKTAVRICSAGTCGVPVTEIRELETLLTEVD